MIEQSFPPGWDSRVQRLIEHYDISEEEQVAEDEVGMAMMDTRQSRSRSAPAAIRKLLAESSDSDTSRPPAPRPTTMPQSATRIPIKLHRHVSLIRTAEPILVEELLARKTLARLVAGRLSETVLLVRPEEEDAVLDELRRMGHTPRIVR